MGRTPHCASFAASACTPARSRQAARLVFPQRPTGVPHLPRRRVRRATQMAGDVPRGEVPGTGEPVQRRAEMRRAAEDALPPLTRSEKMKARWRDPVWRAAMLASRNTAEAARQRSDAARRKWQDPAFRKKMRAARVGRTAWNRGESPSDVTRLRMSLARRGVKKSEETRRRMSEAKLQLPDESWKRLISESKLGKTRHYFQMRREYRALKADLRLWSDSYRLTHGRLPRVSNFEAAVVAPMLVLKIRRYVTLSINLGEAERQGEPEILHFDGRSPPPRPGKR